MTAHENAFEQRAQCLVDLDRVRMMARGEPTEADPTCGDELSAVLGRILRAAQHPGTDNCSEPGRPSGMDRLLALRQVRLDHLSEDVLSAVARGDGAAARGGMYRFHALATAMLDGRPGSCPARSRHARRRLRTHPTRSPIRTRALS